jgi:DNA-directed RNA polymerase subunit M/transcription elongation factor TFIIS
MSFSNKLSKKQNIDIEESLKLFANNYAKLNDAMFLLDEIYETKKQELLNALKNDDLINNIKTKQIVIKDICQLKPEQLFPNRFSKIISKKEKEFYKKNNTCTSDVFKCNKCGARKCQVSQQQTRSGDEPATTFVTCVECGHSFSF